MAISLIQEPQVLHPAYNDSVYIFNSTNKLEANFRYLVDVYDELGTTYVKRYRVAPRPVDGYCEVDLSSYLQSRITYDLFNTTINGASTSIKSVYPYKLKVGEEYTFTWQYDDFGYTTSGVSIPFEGKVRLGVSNLNAQPYAAGDYINVTQTDGGVAYPQLEGLQQILYVISSTAVVINVDYFSLTLTTPMGGTATIATNEAAIFPNLYTPTARGAFNGSLDYINYVNYDWSLFETDSTQTVARVMSNLPENFYIGINQPLYINFNYYTSEGPSVVTRVLFKNSNGDVFRSNDITTNQTTANPRPWVRQITVGSDTTMAVNVVSGTPGLIKSDTEWYTFQLVKGSDVGVSIEYKVFIDNRCKINDIQLLFLDRLGSWGSFNFQLRKYEKYDINKSTYNKTLQYNNFNGIFDGITTYNSTLERSFQINTNWMTEEMGFYFEELVSSPIVMFRMSVDDQWQPCQVMVTSGENVFTRNKRMIKKDLTIKSSFIEKINI